jgi:hypothetical protein
MQPILQIRTQIRMQIRTTIKVIIDFVKGGICMAPQYVVYVEIGCLTGVCRMILSNRTIAL